MRIEDIKKSENDRVRGVAIYNRCSFYNHEPNPRGTKVEDMKCITIDATAYEDKDKFGNLRPGKKRVCVSMALLRATESVRQKIERIGGRDRFVYDGVCNMYIDGAEYFTISELAQMMGIVGKITKKQYIQIRDSLLRIMGSVVFINNAEEAEAYGYPLIDEFGNLAYMKIINMDTINQDELDKYLKWKSEHKLNRRNTFKEKYIVHLFEIPFLLKIAVARNQITTIDAAVRQVPNFYRTELASDIEEELLDLIEINNNRGLPTYINIDNFMERLDIPARYKKRVIATFKKLLSHYKKINYIKSYKIKGDCITIISKNTKLKKRKTKKSSKNPTLN